MPLWYAFLMHGVINWKWRVWVVLGNYSLVGTEANRTEQNRTEANRTEQNRTEANRTEQNRTEANRTEQNRS